MAGSIALLAEARATIAIAQDKVVAVSAALEVALTSETPKEHMSEVRTAVRAAQEQLRVAHGALKEVLQSIRIEAGASASGTTSVN